MFILIFLVRDLILIFFVRDLVWTDLLCQGFGVDGFFFIIDGFVFIPILIFLSLFKLLSLALLSDHLH